MPDTGKGHRSALNETDWHEFEEQRFVREFSARLNKAAHASRFDRLILVAPPKVLGELRDELEKAAAERVVDEIAKDLTKHPVDEIERAIARKPAG
jgi:protein required for attachment to host cells